MAWDLELLEQFHRRLFDKSAGVGHEPRRQVRVQFALANQIAQQDEAGVASRMHKKIQKHVSGGI